jgi:hypothetical protein
MIVVDSIIEAMPRSDPGSFVKHHAYVLGELDAMPAELGLELVVFSRGTPSA